MATGGYGMHAFSPDYRLALDNARERQRPAYGFRYICQRGRLTPADLRDPECVVGAPGEGEPAILLWGDSNASHYVGIVGAFAAQAGARFRNAENQSCPPIFGDPVPYLFDRDRANCIASIEAVRAHIDRYAVIVLAASWPGYAAAAEGFVDRLTETVLALVGRGKHVVLIGKAPVQNGVDRRCALKAARFPGVDCAVAPAQLDDDVKSINARLRQFAEGHTEVGYFDLTDALCRNQLCAAFDEQGESLYVDPHHLSLPAAWRLGRSMLARDGMPEAFAVAFDHARRGASRTAGADPGGHVDERQRLRPLAGPDLPVSELHGDAADGTLRSHRQ
ncbi:MAG: hypothetical protein KDH20_08175 [Rhodocyclaceae bacterium]|nr:hypothetical protein [Rhodocyclaceae bacterium]